MSACSGWRVPDAPNCCAPSTAPIRSSQGGVKGASAVTGSPLSRSIAFGLGLIPEDRKTEGLFLIQSVGFNIMSASLGRILRRGLLALRLEGHRQWADRPASHQDAGRGHGRSNPGGNQQKCVLARLVSAGCEIMLADEPTRGVDVAAKREIYDLLGRTRRGGLAIVMASSGCLKFSVFVTGFTSCAKAKSPPNLMRVRPRKKRLCILRRCIIH